MVRIHFLLFILVSLIFISCEDHMVLRSEKKMKSEIQGKWSREFLGNPPFTNPSCFPDTLYYQEFWVFDGDNWYTTYEFPAAIWCDYGYVDFNKIDRIDTVITGKFKIDAKLTRAYLKFQLIDKGVDSSVFVDKWEFIELEDDILYVATDDPVSNTVLQREFFKVK